MWPGGFGLLASTHGEWGHLCTAMNGTPDEGDTHQLALMTSRFLRQAGPSPLQPRSFSHTRARTHTAQKNTHVRTTLTSTWLTGQEGQEVTELVIWRNVKCEGT